MDINDKSQKKDFIMVFWRRLVLRIWLPFVLLELVVIFFGGLAYFLLFFWLFHIVLTSIVLTPSLAKIILGDKLYKNSSTKLIKRSLLKYYIAYWLFSNIAFLVLAIISFKYNVRLVDIFFM
jgi:hypothetical protein